MRPVKDRVCVYVLEQVRAYVMCRSHARVTTRVGTPGFPSMYRLRVDVYGLVEDKLNEIS